MKRILAAGLVALSSLLSSGCSSLSVEDYAQNTPKLELFGYFNGQTQAWGQFQDRSGKVIRRFVVDIEGKISADGQKLVLDEKFIYDDGEKQQRIWIITQTAANRFVGEAADVIGQAQGESAGNALNWRYTLDLPYKDSSIHVEFDDWMFLQDEQTLINRASVSKWGFHVGEVTLFFRKSP